MFGRASGACFGAALLLAGLALGSAALNEQRTESSEFLDLLTIVFIVASIAFLSLCVISGLIFVGVWAWGYLHAVEVLPGQWYFRFWPHERLAQASGIAVRVRKSAGAVNVKCRAQIGRDGRDKVVSIAEIPAGLNRTYGPEFPQQRVVDLGSDPNEGDVAWLVVNAWPSWWRGRPSELIQMVNIGVTDHRPAAEENGLQQLIRVTPSEGKGMKPAGQGTTVWEIDAYLDVETIDQSRPLSNCRIKLLELEHYLRWTDKNKGKEMDSWVRDSFYQGQAYFFSWSGRPDTIEAVDIHKSERASIAKCINTRPELTTTAGAVCHLFYGEQYHLIVEVTAENSLPLTKEYWLQMFQGNRPVIEKWDANPRSILGTEDSPPQ